MADCGKLAKTDVQKAVDLVAGIIRTAGQSALVYGLKQNRLVEQKAAEYSDDEAQMLSASQQNFLKNIGLDSDTPDADANEVEEDLESSPDSKWSNAFFAMSCIDNIFVKCDSAQLSKML